MKKLIATTVIASMCLLPTTAFASIADENVVYEVNINTETGEQTVITDKTTPTLKPTAALSNGAIRVIVDNKELAETGVAVDGRTLIPLRALGESLGAKVEWNNANQQIRIEKMLYQTDGKGAILDSNRILIMTLGNKQMLRNGNPSDLEVAPQTVNGKTMVPVRAVTDFLEAKITYDNATKTVFVESAWTATPQGAVQAQQNTQVAYNNTVDDYMREINRKDAIEREKAEKEDMDKSLARGEAGAYGYFTDKIMAFPPMTPPMMVIGMSGRDEAIERDMYKVDFVLNVLVKDTKTSVATFDFKYDDYFDWDDDTRNYSEISLFIDPEYINDDKYDYEILVKK